MVLAVPHQDVLIIGDIQDNTGYDVLAHMTMDFFLRMGLYQLPLCHLSIIMVNLNRYL